MVRDFIARQREGGFNSPAIHPLPDVIGSSSHAEHNGFNEFLFGDFIFRPQFKHVSPVRPLLVMSIQSPPYLSRTWKMQAQQPGPFFN
jgi:hypothetical protein